MTWTKLGDEFPAEARDLTDAEFRTHVEALIWSNTRMLDLVIPKRDVRRFAESAAAEDAVSGLAGNGWWEDRGTDWFVGVRFAEWQEERTDTERRRALDAQRHRRFRKHRLGDHSLCDPRRCRESTRDVTRDATREMTPSRPDPTRPEGNGSGKGTRPVPDSAARNGAAGRAGPPGPADSASQTNPAAAAALHKLPPCPHGMPGGAEVNGSGVLRCPECRREAPALFGPPT